MVDHVEAGQALAEARRNGTGIETLPGGLPTDEAAAYRIQKAAVEAFGDERIGYKIGATSPQAQQMLNTDHPFRAPMFARTRHDLGAVVQAPAHGLLGLEPEFALRLGEDLPARSEPYTLDEVKAAIASVHPAFEIIGLRLPLALFTNAIVVTADFGANVGFMPGEGLRDWQGHDLSTIAVRAAQDGKEVAAGSGAAVMGHPLNALLWLVNELASGGEGLAAGDWISTGTCAGVVKVTPGQTTVADFGPFGQVSLTMAS